MDMLLPVAAVTDSDWPLTSFLKSPVRGPCRLLMIIIDFLHPSLVVGGSQLSKYQNIVAATAVQFFQLQRSIFFLLLALCNLVEPADTSHRVLGCLHPGGFRPGCLES